MKKKKLTQAERAWLGLGLYILGSDIYLWRTDNDTMSIQFGHWIQSKQGRIVCMLITTGMLTHLWYGVPLPFQTQAKRYLGGHRNRTRVAT